MLWMGIDPGLGGGIAVLDDNGTVVLAAKMPETDADVLSVMREATVIGWPVSATLEFVRSSPQMGVASAFKFGRGYGALKMALLAAGIPHNEVLPRKWQGLMGCLTGGDKNVSKRRAQELFPTSKVTHALADALLLAEYGRRTGIVGMTRTMPPARTEAF